MSLDIIDAADEIGKCQKMLDRVLQRAGEFRRSNIGHRGVNQDMNMYWLPEEKFWWAYQKAEDKTPRHWNAFGLDEPFPTSKNLNIACEINFPLSKGNWHVAGAFAKDESGEVYIVHSGKIGGGRKEIGKKLFMSHFAGSQQWIDVRRNRKIKKVVVVSPLDDVTLVQNLAHFVVEVRRIKGLASKEKRVKGGRPTSSGSGKYSREFGDERKPYSTSREIRAKVEHGKIVHSLHNLAASKGITVWNNQQTDLFLQKNKTAIVEVKTRNDTQSRYTAIGQLLYHYHNNDMTLVAVFPSLENDFKKVLKRLGIVAVAWSKHGNEYKFDRHLNTILEEL